MQVKNDYVLFATGASLDAQDQMVSIFKIIDKMRFGLDDATYKKFLNKPKDEIIMMAAQCVMASSWSFEKPLPKELDVMLRTQIIDPDGRSLGNSRNGAQVAPGSHKLRLSGEITNIPVTKNGIYVAKSFLTDVRTNKVICEAEFSYEISVEKES